MQRVSLTTLQRVELAGVRTAAGTNAAVSKLGDYPYFVHKWTKQKRHYTSADLRLPDAIFVRGAWPDWNRSVVGAAGTRSPTVETFCLVSNVVREIALSGTVVISGGVPGVDLAAHLSATDTAAGATVAVLANPVDLELRGHEWSNTGVAAKIEAQGSFVSEYSRACEVGGPEFCERLLARDRIISGLSDMLLVFECSEDSATVDTARRALAQGKKVACINSVRRSIRNGIEQLAGEFDIPTYDERTNTPREIAQAILKDLQALRAA